MNEVCNLNIRSHTTSPVSKRQPHLFNRRVQQFVFFGNHPSSRPPTLGRPLNPPNLELCLIRGWALKALIKLGATLLTQPVDEPVDILGFTPLTTHLHFDDDFFLSGVAPWRKMQTRVNFFFFFLYGTHLIVLCIRIYMEF